jgi:hypothetical protein
VNVLAKRPQNDVIGMHPSRSQKDGSQRVPNHDCSWKKTAKRRPRTASFRESKRGQSEGAKS